MANKKNETYTTTYNLKALADFSSVISSFKKVQQELANKADRSDMWGIEKTIDKMSELLARANKIVERGFSSNEDIKLYSKIMDTLNDTAESLSVKLANLHFKDLDKDLKEARLKLKSLENDVTKVVRASLKQVATLLSDILGKQDYADLFMEARKDAEKVREIEATITKELLDLIDAQKQLKEETEKRINDLANNPVSGSVNKANSAFYGQLLYVNKGVFSYKDKNKGPITDTDFERLSATYKKIIADSRTAAAALAAFRAEIKKFGVVVNENSGFFRRYEESFEQAFKVKNMLPNTEAAQAELAGLETELLNLINKKASFDEWVASGSLLNSFNNIANAEEKVSEQTKTVNDAFERVKKSALPAELQNIDLLLESLKDSSSNANNELSEFSNTLNIIKNVTDSLLNSVKQILSITTSWRIFRQLVHETYNDVKELDKSFAQIAMVTNYNVSDLWARYDEYAQLANRLGQSTQSVVEASGLYYQLGLETASVMELTEQTMKLATLAGLDFKEATSLMTAAIRGFHMEMNEGQRVTDVYAEVAAHAAVDVLGLSDAMSACASIANSAGMLFETTTAMLATMAEATLESPKNLGTALKTVIARFTELKENVAGTADSEFEDLDYNKVDKALKSVGILLKDTAGQFRNLDDVFLDLGEKWNTLDRNSQRYIATIAA